MVLNIRNQETRQALNNELKAIAQKCASLRVNDNRSADEILGESFLLKGSDFSQTDLTPVDLNPEL